MEGLWWRLAICGGGEKAGWLRDGKVVGRDRGRC